MLIPLHDLLKPAFIDEDERYQILLNREDFSLSPAQNLKEGHILLNKISGLKDSIRSVFYKDHGRIVENEHRALLLDIPFIREDFKLENLEMETIKKNIHVQNCLRTKCVLPMREMLSNGYSIANFIFEKEMLNPHLIQIVFVINFNKNTTQENYMQVMQTESENKSLIFKSHLLYNEFILRSTGIIEKSYDFLIEFYKTKSQIKFSEEEAAKKPSMLSLKKEYPAKFNHLILGYEDIDVLFHQFDINSNLMLKNLLEDLSVLKIKYLTQR